MDKQKENSATDQTKKKIQNKRYIFAQKEGDDFSCIKLAEGKYKDIIYKYNNVKFSETENANGEIPLKFTYDIFLNPNKGLFIFVSHITLIYIFILFIIYLSTPFDLHWHLDSSASRVIKSLCFFLGLFGIYNLSLRTNE